MSDLTQQALRKTFGSFATGVTVVTTASTEGDHGMTLNAFMSVSLEPPLVSISLARDSRMLRLLRRSRTYVVNVLRHDMGPLAMHFSGRTDPNLRDVLVQENGCPVIPGAMARIFTHLESEVEAGDHAIMIGRVTAVHRETSASPLLFCHGRFHQISNNDQAYGD